MTVVFMQSDRLWYRPPEIDDAELAQRWLNDPRVRRNLLRAFPLSLEAEREWVKSSVIPVGAVPKTISLLFGPTGVGEPIGSAGLFRINWVVRAAEWGILIGEPEQWNKGFAREVARAFLRYAFVELNLNRVTLNVNATNTAGVKAYEATGFKREGLMREATYIDGELQDVIAMAVMRCDWDSSTVE